MRNDPLCRSGRRLAAGSILAAALVAFLCPAGALAQASPGTARIWFYRDYEPSVSLNIATVALNGAPAGYVQPDGSAIYRDVPAGRYHITVDSAGTDVNQSRDVDLAPGQEAYVKILALSSWDAGGDKSAYQRDTFYVSLVPPQVARAQLAAHPASGG